MPQRIITYSRNIFLPLTTVCHNRCGYCSFRTPVHEGCVLFPEYVEETLRRGAALGCTEALFTFGERPGLEPGFQEILAGTGFSDILDYCYDLCEKAISLNPNYADAWSKKSLALFYLERIEDALAASTRASTLNGNDVTAWYIKGVCLDEMGRTDEAQEAYGRSLELEIILDMHAEAKKIRHKH
ncbi:MAG: FO synthase subunit 1 [Methanoregulaceae archaeon PtaU1.Bin222]|nr:MAG: FO synthase subunit 1 [Methanoregulaceae archaeon PtaU1.Bin222]